MGGHGTCRCGECICDAGYRGDQCEECIACVDQRNLCAAAQDCSQCLSLSSCVFCQYSKENSTCQTAALPCENPAKKCASKSAPLIPQEAVTYGGIALGVLLFFFLLVLLILKLIVMRRNRKMFAAWRKEQEENMFNANSNPLFVQAETEFLNPLFETVDEHQNNAAPTGGW
eukprot:Amastigsp_a510366_213.p4 type:complete len:172 gc:universal Amastigsp_a510366_213:1-516(+)